MKMIDVLLFLIFVHPMLTTIDNHLFSRIDIIPTSSCQTVENNSFSLSYCVQQCLYHRHSIHVVSRNTVTKECVCCNLPLSGPAKIGMDWMSFSTLKCPQGYTTHQYTYFKICLKYVSVYVKYPDAVNHCNADGGDLIRIDSQQKFDIFKTHLGPFVHAVWVQGKKEGTVWKFHDGTPIPNPYYCHLSLSNSQSEIYIRYNSVANACVDASLSHMYHYMCEIV
ncbi:uncharacterized protein LOC125663154 [Ostrea edulis]|uniref:uncharacterized protein LOC125663154 n=1 Tax=Ostrea edulis TaxID=37623 RepID=UPI0020947208|nr:uncharacterized protein LOC125663154 [Ostrea edulis]XP_056001954.1 uncharacterized protein LOC125663154 [Ostrea edulis]